MSGHAAGVANFQIIGKSAAFEIGPVRIDRHRPFNRPGCRIIALICLYQRGRAGSSAAVPAANIFFGLGCCIFLTAILERKPCDITAQACSAVVCSKSGFRRWRTSPGS